MKLNIGAVVVMLNDNGSESYWLRLVKVTPDTEQYRFKVFLDEARMNANDEYVGSTSFSIRETDKCIAQGKWRVVSNRINWKQKLGGSKKC